jgi:hypothetical protein
MKADTVNEMHEATFGHPKHRGWMHFNEFFALLDAAGLSILLHGVMRLEQDLIKIDGEEIRPVMAMTRSLQHLAERQHAEVPCAPVRGFAEADLFKELIGQTLERCQSVGDNHSFEDMACRWNKDHTKGSNCDHKKLSAGKATRHRAFFPLCLDDTTICNGKRRKSCLRFKDKVHPSMAKVMAERERHSMQLRQALC